MTGPFAIDAAATGEVAAAFSDAASAGVVAKTVLKIKAILVSGRFGLTVSQFHAWAWYKAAFTENSELAEQLAP